MKYTLLLTQRCNLACDYCYVGQRASVMPLETAAKIIDFAHRTTPVHEAIELGFFGGEPLLEFDRLRDIVALVEGHRDHDPDRVRVTVVSNGTVFSTRIGDFIAEHGLGFGVSCDGPPDVQDRHRIFHDGSSSSKRVEGTIRRAVEQLGGVMVNAVYGPDTLDALPRTVAYLSDLGVRQIYLNPDYSADWTAADIARLPEAYGAVADVYCRAAEAGDRHFVSLIDGKISVILRGGYDPLERCRMGRGEFAFTPDGAIFPCERLVGDGHNGHVIGHIDTGVHQGATACQTREGPLNEECAACGMRDYCMNWCGCSNYFASGNYARVSPFLCASERAEARVALRVLEELPGDVGRFSEHAGGHALVGSIARRPNTPRETAVRVSASHTSRR